MSHPPPDEAGKKRGVSMERSKASTKEKKNDRPSPEINQ